MSMPIPSPSMKAMSGLSGTFNDESGLMVMRWPVFGTAIFSYCIPEYEQLACRTVTTDQHGHLERLFVVEARVDRRLIGTREIRIREAASTARAFGDVL